ncbi:MAG: hypothetical protein IPK78_03475 [Rhodospirillales bacterium]|nr:hypothetical protein [Rhodospirillales bacterium]
MAVGELGADRPQAGDVAAAVDVLRQQCADVRLDRSEPLRAAAVRCSPCRRSSQALSLNAGDVACRRVVTRCSGGRGVPDGRLDGDARRLGHEVQHGYDVQRRTETSHRRRCGARPDAVDAGHERLGFGLARPQDQLDLGPRVLPVDLDPAGLVGLVDTYLLLRG